MFYWSYLYILNVIFKYCGTNTFLTWKLAVDSNSDNHFGFSMVYFFTLKTFEPCC